VINRFLTLLSISTCATTSRQHVAVAVDTAAAAAGDRVKIYLDAVDVTVAPTGAVTIGDGGASVGLTIGGNRLANGNLITCYNYAGYIDDVRIWSAALLPLTIGTWWGGAGAGGRYQNPR
jgi:hypothetical protein